MFNWPELGHMATGCKHSEFPAFLAFVLGGGEEMIENEWEQVVAQPINNVGHTFKAPVLLLGFSPREISSYVLREICTRIVTDGYIACNSRRWNLLKCQQANS